MRVASAERKHVSGFTLVEMAIVLVIIGIILAGVMKGRDIVRGAQVKQFSQQFAQKWGTVCQTYYDKTGQQLNDGTDNGGTGNPNGVMDGGACDRAPGLVNTLNSVGISVCTIIKSKLLISGGAPVTGTAPASHCNDRVNVFQTLVEGEYAGSQTVTLNLVGLNLTYGTGANAKTYARNVVVIYNVPIDVCRGLDTAIDGKEDGEAGNCVALTAAVAPAVDDGTDFAAGAAVDLPTVAGWGNANTGNSQTMGIVLDY